MTRTDLTGDVLGLDPGRYHLAVVAAPLLARFPVRPACSGEPARNPMARAGLVRLLVMLALVVVGTLLAAPTSAVARPAQDPDTSTTAGFPVETTTTVVVTTTAPAPTTASTTTASEPSTSSPSRTRVADENRKIWLVVAGLVAVAIALTLLTIRYWRHTRPVPQAIGAPALGDVPPAPALFGGRTGESTASPDAVEDPEPASDAGTPTAVTAAATLTGAAAAVDRSDAGDDADLDPGPATEAIPVVVIGDVTAAPVAASITDDPLDAEVGEGRTSRRAVAGADHAGADDTWEPRGTGEHERVVIPAAVRRARPTPAQRAAAFDAAKRS